MVPALSFAKGIESDSVLEVDYIKKFINIIVSYLIRVEMISNTLKLASDPFRRWRNPSIAGLPGSVSDVSILSLGLHSLPTIFNPDIELVLQ